MLDLYVSIWTRVEKGEEEEGHLREHMPEGEWKYSTKDSCGWAGTQHLISSLLIILDVTLSHWNYPISGTQLLSLSLHSHLHSKSQLYI